MSQTHDTRSTVLTITHTAEAGTLIAGTSRGDGSAELLKASGWRWGRSIAAWYVPQSRDRLPKQHTITRTVTALQAAGFAVELELNHTLRPTAEAEAARIERQAARVDALEQKATTAAVTAEAADAAARSALDRLPWGGEPIKVGHHSETRHRNAIAKADTAMGRSVATDQAAATAQERADIAAGTTDARYAPQLVARRIERLATDIRQHTRRIEGSSHNFGGGHIETTPPATGARLERLTAQRAQLQDEHDYWTAIRQEQADAGTVTIHSRDTIARGDWIRNRFEWSQVTRVNPKTVTVALSWHDTHRPYAVAYGDILDHRTAEHHAAQTPETVAG